jgi:hypothetical protein
MKWFRSNIKTGSRLALFALALQFALSFGHFHTIAAPALTIQAIATQSDIASGLTVPDATDQSARQPASNPDSDQKPSDPCAICAVIALANAVLFATPPLLLLPQAIELPYLTTDAEFVHLNSARLLTSIARCSLEANAASYAADSQG